MREQWRKRGIEGCDERGWSEGRVSAFEQRGEDEEDKN